MTPLAILCLIALCAMVLFAPRRWALLAMVAAMIYLTQRGGLVLFGLRMPAARFLEMAGFIRVLSRGEVSWDGANRLDRAVVAAYAYVTAAYLVRTMFGYGTSSAVHLTSTLSQVALTFDILIAYTIFRGLILDIADFRWVLRSSVLLLVPFVLLLGVEKWTGRNPLAVIGAIPQVWIDSDSDITRVRCMGSFLHPSLLGTFGASFAVMYVGLTVDEQQKAWGWIGVALGVAIVLLANSGGPATYLAVGVVGWLLWFARLRMRLVRAAMLGTIVVLALIMRDPIWYLPSKMSLLFGGGGWHRSYLMQQAFTHISQWWLAGMPLDLTVSWFPYLVKGAADITNLYVGFGVDGGILAICFLIWLIVCGFSGLGQGLLRARQSESSGGADELLLWGLGVALAGHVVNFISITYFDQTNLLWLMQLAAVSSISAAAAWSGIGSSEILADKELARRGPRLRLGPSQTSRANTRAEVLMRRKTASKSSRQT